MVAVKIISAIALAYMVGSLPMGVMIGRFIYKKDIRQYGSGNTGMANAYRTLGPSGGVIVLAADIAKGAVAVTIPRLLFFPVEFPSTSLPVNVVISLCGLAAIFGASYSIFLKFSGGKSVGASAGVIISLFPYTIPFLFGLWLAVVALTRYISAGAIAISLAFPILVLLFYPGHPELVAATVIFAVLIIYRHRSNIVRLLNGTERRFYLSPKKEES
ncbi:MAG: glycerol-3-phosphate 1-O-acyltransferase PlsY [Actinobacteria bacterium]|nr:glycerol-3-phosphate 1-O-acyltransferase PlsY [Chloroflexota bacterium]MCL5292274.1 glycerol-3-phosphate 1-O-acyltransferase PlsY [Actinomycetota bacterium]